MNKGDFATDQFSQTSDVLDIVLDNIPQGIVIVDKAYRMVAFNRPMFDIFRLPPGTFRVGIDFRDVLRIWARSTGQDAEMLERAIRELDMPEPFSFEHAQDILGELRSDFLISPAFRGSIRETGLALFSAML